MDHLVSTGQLIVTYLSSNGFKISDLEKKCEGVSQRTIARVIKDESKLPLKVAEGVNRLIPEIDVGFLLSYDAQYQYQKTKYQENKQIDINEYITKYRLEKLYPDYRGNRLELFEKGFSVFGSEKDYGIDLSELSYGYSLANNNKKRDTDIWLKCCYEEFTQKHQVVQFNRKAFEREFKNIKSYIRVNSIESAIYNIKKFCELCGINFSFRPSIPNSRIRAVTVVDKENRVYIFISDLFKCVETLLLSFVHETIHINNEDYNKFSFMSIEDTKENEEYVDEEVIKYLTDDEFSLESFKLSDINNYSTKWNLMNGLISMIYRSKSKVYDDYGINKYLHYYTYDSFIKCFNDDNGEVLF